jgi:hypothetical protein
MMCAEGNTCSKSSELSEVTIKSVTYIQTYTHGNRPSDPTNGKEFDVQLSVFWLVGNRYLEW